MAVVPSAPEHVSVSVLSDTAVAVLWSDPLEPNGPLGELRYQVEINGNIFRPGIPVKIHSKNEQKSFQIDNLQGGRDYTLRVLSFPPVGGSFSGSLKVSATTFSSPISPIVLFVSNTTANISCELPKNENVKNYWIELWQNDTFSKTNNSNIWATVHQGPCNTSVCSWHYGGLQGIYQFRVAAVNSLGAGNFSDISKDFVLFHNGCRLNKNKQRGNTTTFHVNYHPDLELAHIRGMHTAVIQTNVWYSSSYLPTQLELESLPIFPRDQLTLMSFLGSGAFGEVFEGVAKDIMAPGTGNLKVAVKTLRKGATDLEKSEFLKEACLMSHFDHPHIIKLWGVCLQNEPQFLLLELMEGKDLLSFLRGARGTPYQDPLLGIGDLIAICIDVARGCTYLEKMHFVHRDLAARNCLVSVKEYTSHSRKVKIGDFGLARDIYKNDYYRKEGESLLPVRWMAPESLIDGVFTNQSDVWSFGVLMWEVMTLGQQPYPARTNPEVLHFVRSGGRLERPCNCPDNM
ncbi:proto-oncogene tyrosine-protein kinase ROS-like [Trichosurus vulpecula]|uniref:proto-oncogene tyrosine-protein kinase ROS-like n=1 Tax=Trichosurus vulpecula TaxID=9337 RepID=UPI00186ADE92|nr:proto-oncogene tyrosine-protein kinase ROS-like [Trichosurus vulpecula]